MKLLLALLLSVFVSTAYAQSGSSKSTAQLNSEVNTTIANTSIITPQVLRQILLDVVASTLGPQTGVTSPHNQILAGPATGNSTGAPTFRSVVAADLPPTIQLSPMAFSSVPSCTGSTKGLLVSITDSSTTTWGATVSGGGSNSVLGYCNGVHYTVAAR